MSELTLLFSKLLVTDKLDLSEQEYNILNSVYDRTPFRQTNPDDPDTNDIGTDLEVLNNNDLSFLKSKVMDLFEDFNKQILKYNAKFQITTSWFTNSEQGKYGQYHSHSNSMFSGVFYFTENPSSIRFANFNRGTSFGLTATEYNVYNSSSWEVKPSKGTILLFPSELHHYVELSNNIRKSLAFNVVPTGKYGASDSKVNINYA